MVRILLLLLILITSNANGQPKKPNILWITCEDISPYLGSYGEKAVKTPNIDQLAREGVRYTNMFTTAGVCAPSRSTIITGMYPMSIGTQHMRSMLEGAGKPELPEGIPPYAAVIPEFVKAFPEYLRMAGYYTSNNAKTDYQFEAPVTVWDENSSAASYRNRATGQPFFAIFNNQISHEMHLSMYKDSLEIDPAMVAVPPYFPDTKEVRKDIARALTNIQAMDRNVGNLIAQLKADGLYDSTIIIFFSDHGGPLPWMKREVLDRGLKVPFIVRYPNGTNAGTVVNDLVSSIDLAPSMLSLAGIPVPSYMQGQAFIGGQKSNTQRSYIHACKDRMDKIYERVRLVRDKRFAYIYNYFPEKPGYMDISFRRDRVPMMNNILTLRDAGKLNKNAMSWFKAPKEVEELYDCEKDPHQLKNLAKDPKYAAQLKLMRDEFKRWTAAVGDMSEVPEKEMISKWWNGASEPPSTATPEITTDARGNTIINCSTKGASIGYRIIRSGDKPGIPKHTVYSFDGEVVFSFLMSGQQRNGALVDAKPVWSVYTKPIQLNIGDTLIVNAQRIGYKPAMLSFIEQ